MLFNIDAHQNCPLCRSYGIRGISFDEEYVQCQDCTNTFHRESVIRHNVRIKLGEMFTSSGAKIIPTDPPDKRLRRHKQAILTDIKP